MKNPVRAVVASDQPIFRRGLATLVMSVKKVDLVGEARDPAEALQLCELLQPDVILLDFKTSLEEGKNLAQEIHRQWQHTGVILIIGAHEEIQVSNLEGEGTYFFSKEILEEEFAAAIQRIGKNRIEARQGIARDYPGEEQLEKADSRRTSPVLGIPKPAGPSASEILQRELVTAGKIQADILPEKPPAISGWEISAKLESARETSGDFYDFIPLPNGHWGIIVADVTDKGMGAALFMALSSTLLRTYAARYPTMPALTMDVVNERILTDTRGGMFVTAFYGVLEPHTGRFRYVNAGHPPPCLVSHQKGKKPVDHLNPTGMALGLMDRAQWQQKMVRLSEGDVLVLYTDGVTEAQNPYDAFFGDDRLTEVVRSKSTCSADETLEAIFAEVHRFVGDTPRQDDIAIIVIRRKE
jgi:DNA-binding NarL/FixJ family response regulator